MHLSLSILLRTFSFHLHLLFIWQASEVQLEGQPALCPAEAAQPVPDLYPLTLCSRGVPKPFRQNFPAAWPNSLHSTAVCQLEMCTHLCRGRTGGTPHVISIDTFPVPGVAWLHIHPLLDLFFFFKRNKTPPILWRQRWTAHWNRPVFLSCTPTTQNHTATKRYDSVKLLSARPSHLSSSDS